MSSVLNPVELGRAFVIVVSSSLNRKKCKIKQTKNSPARTRQTLRFDSHMVSLLPTPNADGGGIPLTPAVPTPGGPETSPAVPLQGWRAAPPSQLSWGHLQRPLTLLSAPQQNAHCEKRVRDV